MLRNISLVYIIGIDICLLIICLFILIRICSLRNNSEAAPAESKEKNPGRGSRVFVFILLVLAVTGLVCALRLIRFLNQERGYLESALSFTDKYGEFWTYLATEQEEKQSQSYLIEVEVLGDSRYENLDLGKILVKRSTFPRLDIGQVCLISGNFVEPKNFDDFDYKTYLKNKSIYLILENANLKCLPISKNREGNLFVNKLIDAKNKLIKIIDKNLPEPQSSLLAGILFGQKRAFSEEFNLNTRISGVSHIVAASGYNITILVLVVNRLFFFIKKKPRIIVSIIVLWCFCIISGLSSSIIRASIMSTIALVSIMFGRDNSIHISLPLASLIFTIINPVIVFDVGFQLSILATMGLIYLSPSLEVLLEKLSKKQPQGFVKEYVLTTLSCTLATLPISIFTFKTFSIWSVLANTLILPVVESTMLWGVLAMIVNILSPVIGKLMFLIVYVQLKYFELVVSAIGSLNFGYWEVGERSAGILAFLLSILIFTICLTFYPINNEGDNHYLKIS